MYYSKKKKEKLVQYFSFFSFFVQYNFQVFFFFFCFSSSTASWQTPQTTIISIMIHPSHTSISYYIITYLPVIWYTSICILQLCIYVKKKNLEPPLRFNLILKRARGWVVTWQFPFLLATNLNDLGFCCSSLRSSFIFFRPPSSPPLFSPTAYLITSRLLLLVVFLHFLLLVYYLHSTRTQSYPLSSIASVYSVCCVDSDPSLTVAVYRIRSLSTICNQSSDPTFT